MALCQLSIAPVGTGIHLHTFVEKVIEIIKEYNVKFEVNDMATIIEIDDLEILCNIIKKAHSTLFDESVQRIITEIKIDDRRDRHVCIGSKKQSVI